MPWGLHIWLRHHLYVTLFGAAAVEGLGLPLPSEALFLATAVLIHRGDARLGTVIVVATLGSLLGNMSGFAVAYVGGKKLIHRIFQLLGIKPAALARMEQFFHRYGPLTVFISRYIGFIRAATIYSAGAAHMKPWRFAAYALAASLIWNSFWAYAFFRFGDALPRLLRLRAGWLAVVVVLILALVISIELVLRWRRKRGAAEP
ncbi:MAG: DedA family protein [Mycobacterium leprae]